MGTWGVSSIELVQRLTDFLDELEGDFDKKNLREALKFMEGYCPTSDSTTKEEKVWRNLFANLGADVE